MTIRSNNITNQAGSGLPNLNGTSPAIKYQLKELPADLNGTGMNVTVTGLGFNSLVTGNLYKYYVQLRFVLLADVTFDGKYTIEHNSNVLGEVRYAANSANNAQNGLQTATFVSPPFVAGASSITITGDGFVTNCRLDTATGLYRTYAVLEELPYHVVTTDFT